jgi:LacI family transcriptional regulator, galactose operon repressor
VTTARPITIRDVARRAGVSLSTVSQVLNGRPGWASSETTERILAVARELNYRPNAIARSLILARTGTLGVVITSIVHPLFHRLIEGIGQVASERGYSLILASAEDQQRERAAFEMLSDKRVDGLIFMGNTNARSNEHVAWVVAQGRPVVVINSPVGDLAVHHLGWDDVAVGRLATQHLLDLGHRRIAHLAGPLGEPVRHSARARLAGYRAALQAAGLTLDEELVLEAGYSYANAFAATEHLLALPRRPTAIFAASDSMAIGVINALTRARVWAPAELSVIGVNDDLHARLTEPPLTTVRLPFDQAGRRAAEIILNGLDSSDEPLSRELLTPELVVRASTGRPR